MINSVCILRMVINKLFLSKALSPLSISPIQRTIRWGMFQNKTILGKDAWKLGRKSALFSKAGELKCVQKCLITINSWLMLQIFQSTSLWNTLYTCAVHRSSMFVFNLVWILCSLYESCSCGTSLNWEYQMAWEEKFGTRWLVVRLSRLSPHLIIR